MFDLDALAALARVLGVEQDVAAGYGAVFQLKKLELVGYGAADLPCGAAISIGVAQVKYNPRISIGQRVSAWMPKQWILHKERD